MKRHKNKKTETFTVTAKRFMISCILILSMTGLAAGISYAGGNSRHMAMGESGSTVALAHSEKKLELNINEKTAVTFNLSLPEKYRDYLYFLPAPLSGIFCPNLYILIALVIGVVRILLADNQNKLLLFEKTRNEFFLFE